MDYNAIKGCFSLNIKNKNKLLYSYLSQQPKEVCMSSSLNRPFENDYKCQYSFWDRGYGSGVSRVSNGTEKLKRIDLVWNTFDFSSISCHINSNNRPLMISAKSAANTTPTSGLCLMSTGFLGLGVTDPDAKLHIKNGNILVESTDAGSSVGPTLDLFRNSATPADSDDIGRVLFRGEDSAGGTNTYAAIVAQIDDATNNTEDGSLEFSLRKAGSTVQIAQLTNTSFNLVNGTKLTVGNDILPETTATHNIGSNNIGGISNGRFANAYFSSSVWILDSTSGFMVGSSFDTKFYHSGSASFIDHSGTGALNLRSNNGFGFACSTSGGETAMQIIKNGAVKIYHNNSSNASSDLRLETTSGGIDISGSTDGVLNLDTTDGRGSFIRFKENGTVKGYVGCSEGLGLGDQDDISLRATDRVFIQTGGASETMRLGRSGSHAQVFVNCTETFTSAVFSLQTNGTCGIGLKCGATNTQKHISFRSPNGEVGSVTTNGSATSFNTSSDYRLKENAVAISDGITRLKTLKPYRFNFKTDASTTVDGFFAHEVTAVPEAITGTKDEVDSDNNPVYQGIDQSKLVPLLVAALQEAIGRIEALEAK